MTILGVRGVILGFIDRYPGVHAREIERRLALSNKLATYHLGSLERDGLVRRVDDVGYTRFVPEGLAAQEDIAFICLMRRPVALRITLLLLDEGELQQGEVAKRLGLAKASITYHLARLTKPGIVSCRREGRESYYSVSDARATRRRLRTFEPMPGELGTFAGMWNDIVGA